MKTFLPLSTLSILLTVLMTASAVGQVGVFPGGALTGEAVPGVDTTGMFDPGANPNPHFMTRLATTFPGNVWFRYTAAGNGLGFDTGGFFTLGAKTRLGNDFLDGRWMFEARGHLAHEQGQVFANIGVERVFTITPAKTDIGFNFFFDADGDASHNFGHDFYGVGVGGFLRHEKFEVRGNGYIPVGTTAYRLGSPENCFFLNYIIDQHGIDTALQGADLELSIRPWHWQMLQGHVDVGGYYYQDANEDMTGVGSFGGVRVRGRVTSNRGVSIEAEYNYDERFKATIIGRIVISTGTFGQFSRLGRDLDPTIRNDHIVKWHQDVTFLTDPDTGDPYYVNHVDNTAAPGGDGTFESPFDSLAAVDPLQGGASSPDDIIFVSAGDGTFRNYNTGITLQDRQLLLGDGALYPIPTVGGGEFILCTNADGNKPVLTNITGGAIVTLADDNFVAGLTLTGDNGAAKSSDGIFGASSPSGVTIRNNMIMDLTDDGIDISDLGGDITIVANMISDVDDEGITLGSTGIAATGGTIEISENIISDTGLALDTVAGEQGHGISLANVTAGGTTFLFDSNDLSDVGGDAIRIAGVTGVGFNTWLFTSNRVDGTGTASGSTGGEGIFVSSVAGASDTFMYLTNDVRNADLNGIYLDDITDDTSMATYTFINNTAAFNRQDGIRLSNFDGASVLIDRTMALDPIEVATPIPAPILFTTSQNGGNGVHIANYRNVRRTTDATAIGLDLVIHNHVADFNAGNGIFLDSIDGRADITAGDVALSTQAMPINVGITRNLTNGIFIRNFTNSILGTSIDIHPLLVDPMSGIVLAPTNIIGNDGIDTSGVRVELDAAPANAVASTLSGRITTDLNVTESTFDGNGGGITASVTGGMNELQVSMTDMVAINNHRNDIVDVDVLDGASAILLVRDNRMVVDNNRGAGDFLDLNVDSGITDVQTNLQVTAERNMFTMTPIAGRPPVSIGGAGLRVNVNSRSTLNVDFAENEFDGLGNFGVTMSYSLAANADTNNFLIENNDFDTPIVGDGLRLRTAADSRVAGTFASNEITNVTNSRGINVDAEDRSMLRLELLDNTLIDTRAISGSQDGIYVRSRNTATVLTRIFGNRVENFGANGVLTAAIPDADWGRGIIAIKEDASTHHVLIEKNSVTGSGLAGVEVISTQNDPPTSISGGTMNALVIDNSLIMNDVTTTPAKIAQRYDFFAETLNDSELCLTLHGNSTTSGYVVGAGPPIFVAGVVPFPAPPPPPPAQAANLTLEEGSNDFDTMQTWQQDNVPAIAGVVGVPTTEVTYTTPAASTCVRNYNAAVGIFTGTGWDAEFPTFP